MTQESEVVTQANEKAARLNARVAAMNAQIKREDYDRLAKDLHKSAVEKGFWDEPVMMDKYVAKLMLIVSEVTEVMEALRKSQGSDKVTEEFSDILIRTFDLFDALVQAGEADPELYGVMIDKMKINASRPAKHAHRWG